MPSPVPHATLPPTADLAERIDASPCAAPYFALEECLGETSRSWAACRPLVLALKACNDAAQSREDERAEEK